MSTTTHPTGADITPAARLHAAAPCMLFALTVARAHMRQTIDQAPSTGDTLAGALAVIEDAITKATGGTFE